MRLVPISSRTDTLLPYTTLFISCDVIQTSPISMMIRKGTDQVYAVVEVGERKPDMARINHNGLDVDTDEAVDAAYETLVRVKDEYGLKDIRKTGITHGDYGFYFDDLDENWWEIVKTRPGLGPG